MKHPGFLRLISALYMLAPRLRLLQASFDLGGFDLCGLDLLGGDVDLMSSLHVRGRRLRLHGGQRLRLRGRRWSEYRRKLAHRPMPEQPASQSHRDEREAGVEELERSAYPGASARGTRRDRSA